MKKSHDFIQDALTHTISCIICGYTLTELEIAELPPKAADRKAALPGCHLGALV
jgi:hypothetical protein